MHTMQVPAMNIFESSLKRGKFDESRKLSNGKLLEFSHVFPMDAVFDKPEDVPEEVCRSLSVFLVIEIYTRQRPTNCSQSILCCEAVCWKVECVISISRSCRRPKSSTSLIKAHPNMYNVARRKMVNNMPL